MRFVRIAFKRGSKATLLEEVSCDALASRPLPSLEGFAPHANTLKRDITRLGLCFRPMTYSRKLPPRASRVVHTIVIPVFVGYFSHIDTTDQLGRAVGLPEEFLSDGEGGGVMQGSACEATLVAVVTARTRALKHMRRANPGLGDHELMAKMTLYTSDQVREPAPIEALPSS